MTLPAEMLPLPVKRKFKPQAELQAECMQLEANNKRVKRLVDACRAIAAGTSFDHPGLLPREPRASRGVRRLLISLGVFHVRAGLLEDRPDLKASVQSDASKEVRRWEEGDAEGDLFEEWEKAYWRCRRLVQASTLGHWPDREVPFARSDVRATLDADARWGSDPWVNDIHYGHIKAQLLREAERFEGV